jgi:UPF0755 protein
VKFARVLLLLVLAGAAYLAFTLYAPYSGFHDETFVDIPRGASTPRIAEMLEHAGVVRHAWAFLLARAVRFRATLQAGEYRFSRPASALEVLDRIARGDIFYHELVVPEGKNMFDIAAAAGHLGLFPAAQFLKAARNPALIRDLDPAAPTLEGYLFPNTYRLSRHTTPEGLCRIMTGQFRQVWRSLGTGAPVHRTITLASLVEKEGKLPRERPVIASLFLRRLEIGMKLDCDSTTIYAALLAGNYRGAIYRSDLASSDPYNTYQHGGLPPGPIANPGVASIQAVLDPANTDYLYFVLRPDSSGGHNFSNSLAAQQAAVAKYRRSLGR